MVRVINVTETFMFRCNDLGQVAHALLTDLYSSLKLQPFAVIEIHSSFILFVSDHEGP